MGTQNDNSDNNLFSTRDELLINSEFPALENYLKDDKRLKEAYKKWLKREVLGKNICYIDLTFELPSKGVTTFSIVPKGKGNLGVYTDILKEFIYSNHTLYPHTVFQNGIRAILKNGKREILKPGIVDRNLEISESFFLYEKDVKFEPTETKKNIKFDAFKINLYNYYRDASEKKLYSRDKIDSIEIIDHWAEWVKLHEAKDRPLLKSAIDGVLKWILVAPLGIVSENGSYKNIGSIFLGMDNKCSKDDVIYFTRSLVLLLLSSSQKYYAKIGLKNSIKSAVSAIMSRNMSHNLGSHVLSNLKGELEDIGKIFKENHDKNDCLPFKSENLFGLKWFINYLQERQDFIATIGGFENQTFMPVNFKTFVFDGLLPDHQFKRHSPSTSLNAHKNYLLEYIVLSENIPRNRIVIKYKDFESSIHGKKNSKAEKDYNKLTQINVSFPGGIVGRQAFFSIFENIIRNAAKHSEIKDKLEITIDTPDGYDYDTNEYIKFTLTDNLKTFRSALSKLSSAINEPIFNESQEKQGNKGIKEMKISAAWLRGIRLEDIDSFDAEIDEKGFIKHPKILDIREDFEGSIQYVFYLLKPKELLFYLTSSENNNLNLTEKEIKSFNEHGIDIITPDYFQEGKNYNLRHSLFVIQKENEPGKKEKLAVKNIEKYFNQRRLNIPTRTLQDIFNTYRAEPKKLLATFWKVYLELENETMPFIDIRLPIIENDEKFEKFRVKLCSESYSDSDIRLLFNHHNDTIKTFDKFRFNYHPDIFKKVHFLEGISGGNSTELLTCRTEKSELFYYKLLQSCVTDVIIIDERLWNNNSKTTINLLSDIINENIPLFNQEMLHEINKINNDIEWAKEILSKLNITITDELKTKISKIFKERNKKAFLDFITQDVLKVEVVQKRIDDCRKENEYKYELFKKKNIEILNIMFDNKNQQKFEFYNLNFENIGEYSSENELKLNLNLNKYTHKIVSIHQGIIDKIQNLLNNQREMELDRLEMKSNAIDIINQAIPDNFVKIIHSGRGKPSVEIPRGFHFVPYASLESAFYDSKFSLTDLLFNAKTELS